jgi:hypothetical protein
MQDVAIAMLSDQVMKLMVEIKELKKAEPILRARSSCLQQVCT